MFVVSTRTGVWGLRFRAADLRAEALDLSLQTPNPPKGQNHVILDPSFGQSQTVSETLVSLSPKP